MEDADTGASNISYQTLQQEEEEETHEVSLIA